MTSDRERALIQQYDSAHRAYLEALEVVREAVFGNGGSAGRVAKSQVTKAKHRLADAERELQDYWLSEAQAQEVSR